MGVEYKEGAYNADNDVWNEVVFETPITTTALQLTIQAKDGAGATDGVGISEWEVYNYISEESNLPESLADYDFADFAAGENDTLVDETRTITLESVGSGVKPSLVEDTYRGQVLKLNASNYNNRAFALLPSNPFAFSQS